MEVNKKQKKTYKDLRKKYEGTNEKNKNKKI